MNLEAIIKSVPEIKRDWPAGVNFQTKSKFVGFSHDGIGGVPNVTLSIEMIESDQWGSVFQPMDKEFIKSIKGLFAALGGGMEPSQDEIMAKGIDHPCRQTCSGWRGGFDRGRFEAREEIARLKRICRDLAAASKSKRMKSMTTFWEQYYL